MKTLLLVLALISLPQDNINFYNAVVKECPAFKDSLIVFSPEWQGYFKEMRDSKISFNSITIYLYCTNREKGLKPEAARNGVLEFLTQHRMKRYWTGGDFYREGFLSEWETVFGDTDNLVRFSKRYFINSYLFQAAINYVRDNPKRLMSYPLVEELTDFCPE